jgi:hypothetical protein
MLKTIAILAALILVSLTPQAKADIIYDNLKSTTYFADKGPAIYGASQNGGNALSWTDTFVASATGNLGDILIPMAFQNFTQGASPLFDLNLSDSSSTVLESWTGLTAPAVGGTLSVVDAVSVLNPLLTSGDTYTLTASPNNTNTKDIWDDINTLHANPGFRVLTPTPTPEPASLTLLCTGLAAFGGFRLRRWRRKPFTT